MFYFQGLWKIYSILVGNAHLVSIMLDATNE